MSIEHSYSVDICATCLVDKPPKLPLREELPSLGFEVILNAEGVGLKASKHESKKALKSFRLKTQKKDLKKRRLFPKSSKRIKEELDERKRIEHELKTLHALSYDDYEQRLEHNGCSSSTSDSTSRSGHSHDSKSAKMKKTIGAKRARRRWGLRKRKKARKTDRDEKKIQTHAAQDTPTIEDMVGQVAFQDFLAPVGGNETEEASETRPLSGKETVSSSTPSKDLSSISSKHDPFTDMEVEFVTSDEAENQLPGLRKVDSGGSVKGKSLDEGVKNAFSGMDLTLHTAHSRETPIQRNPVAADRVADAFADFDATSPVYGESQEPEETMEGTKQEEGSDLLQEKTAQPDQVPQIGPLQNAFEDVDPEVYVAKGDTTQTEKKLQGDQVPVVLALGDAFEAVDPEVYDQEGEKEKSGAVTESLDEKDSAMASEAGKQGWLWSAKHAFENVAAEVYKAARVESKQSKPKDTFDTDQPQHIKNTQSTDISTLFSILASDDSPEDEVQEILGESPELAVVKQEYDGRLPLHTICDRGMPDRFTAVTETLTDVLLKDILSYKTLLALVLASYPDACLITDKKGDLPAHLIARRLMEWEAKWYESVYEQAAKEQDFNGKAADDITSLYHLMSECVEMVLEPVAKDSVLCREPGSIGTILPVHIASIFTASVHILRFILQANPDAAKAVCDLDKLDTFIPDDCLPIELHDKLSTDFPKWEIEKRQELFPEIRWSQTKASGQGLEDCIRRSDLLFAYNPGIEPYRYEKSRIHRFESRIQFEAKRVVEQSQKGLDRATEMIWLFMCSFEAPESQLPSYVDSVKRVIDTLPLSCVKFLAEVKIGDEKSVVDVASPVCAEAIRERLNQVTERIVPIIPTSTTMSSSGITSESSLIKEWEKVQMTRLSSRQQPCIGSLCRRIFNIKETSIPTSFIILPYQVSASAEGKLGIDSAENTELALQYAKHLLQLTDPKSVLDILDAKSSKHHGMPLRGAKFQNDTEKVLPDKTTKETFIALYKPESAYLYLIDEGSGVPVAPPSSSGVYPILLGEPAGMVRKLLPLMLTGMIIMRGERAMSLLVDVLTDDSIAVVPPSWTTVAHELVDHLDSRENESPEKVREHKKMRDSLVDFISRGQSAQKRSDESKHNEWNVELSILKMLLEMNDTEGTFAGLQAKQKEHNIITWTLGDQVPKVFPSEPVFAVDKDSDSGVDVSVLSKKHDELSLKLKRLSSVGIRDLSSHKLDFLQPYDESSISEEELSRQTKGMSSEDYTSSSSSFNVIRRSTRLPTEDYTSEDAVSMSSNVIEIVDLSLSDHSSMVFEELSVKEYNEERDDRKASNRYAVLFDDLGVNKNNDLEEREPGEETVRVWNSSERVWEDVTCRLGTGFWEDAQILQLKVGLAEQAKKLAFLGKKITEFRNEEMRLFSQEEQVNRLLHSACFKEQVAPLRGVAAARKLVIRVGDLEDRVLCDEIETQHLALEVMALNSQLAEIDPECTEDEKSGESVESQERSPHDDPRQQFADNKNEKLLADSVKCDSRASEDDSVMVSSSVGWVKYHESTGLIEI